MKATPHHTHKSVDYSYPTSVNAQRFGFYREGCWVVKLNDPTWERVPAAISGHATKAEALAVLDTMPQPESALMRNLR